MGKASLNGQQIEAVLIDAGGVLVNPNWRTVTAVLARHGVTADPADLEAADPFLKREFDSADHIRDTTDTVLRERWLARLLRHAGIAVADPGAVDASTDQLEALHTERGIWDVVADGAPEALGKLRGAGLRLALASNAEPRLRAKLAELGLAHRFDHLAISGEVGVEKPDPRFFRGAIEALGTTPERAIHVGDLYEIDVVGARSAGLEAVLVDVADLSGDRDVIRIHALAELPSLIGLS